MDGFARAMLALVILGGCILLALGVLATVLQ